MSGAAPAWIAVRNVLSSCSCQTICNSILGCAALNESTNSFWISWRYWSSVDSVHQTILIFSPAAAGCWLVLAPPADDGAVPDWGAQAANKTASTTGTLHKTWRRLFPFFMQGSSTIEKGGLGRIPLLLTMYWPLSSFTWQKRLGASAIEGMSPLNPGYTQSALPCLACWQNVVE